MSPTSFQTAPPRDVVSDHSIVAATDKSLSANIPCRFLFEKTQQRFFVYASFAPFRKKCKHFFRLALCALKQKKILSCLLGGGGFEPPKAVPTDLQSAPFGHSGIRPYFFKKNGGYRVRTCDPLLVRQMLSQLS